MSDETQDKLCEGYLITGEQKNVDGGFTVDFQKRNKFYFILWKRGQHIYNLEGFKDDRTFKGKRKSSTNLFSGRKKSIISSSIPSFILTSTVKVHCMDMTIGRKKNHVIILIHAKIPYYFKTLQENEIKPWYNAFSRVSTDMESRNTVRKASEEVILRKSPALKHTNHTSKDSGRGSTSSSARSSQDSSGSRLSDIISSCPPSPSFIPTNIVIEIDGAEDPDYDDIDDGDHVAPLSSGQKARRRLTNSVIYRRRERDVSSGESRKKFDYTEASSQMYDSVIRTSMVQDDTDGDTPPPSLPQKRRVRRGSEPNLQIPNVFHTRHRDPGHSPELGELRERAAAQTSSSPPPLPARPLTGLPPYYENVLRDRSRKQSEPANICLSSLGNIYEKPPKVQADISRLMWEQSKDMDGIVIEFSKAELLDSLVLTTIKDEVWVASWKKDLNNQLYGKLHVGDKLRQINTQVVTSAELAMEFIRTTASDEIHVTLTRLPHANLLNLNRSNHNIQWGVHLKSNTEIKSLSEGPVLTEGLTPKAKCVYSEKACDWVITEINHQRVPLVKNSKNQDLVKCELEANHRELPLVVQPHDFIKKLTEVVVRRCSQFY